MAKFPHTVLERFLRYVVIDTQSSHTSTTFPSTEKQKDLGRVLVEELRQIGVADAHLDAFGYVYATVPSNTDKQVPVICFCSHMDTSPDVTGKDVKPQIVRNYQGGDIVLAGDTSQVIRVADNPALKDQIGNDIVTTDGTTLLGADNKAGLAEIMDAVNILVNNPQIRHGTIRILFTPDEEVGHGVDHVDIKKLGADFGYTIDGESAGNLEDETFSADKATIAIRGVSAHPGFAKGKIENAIKIAARIVDGLPKDACSPETTEGRAGFVHPTDIAGTLEGATLSFIVRDFDEGGLHEKEAMLERIARDALRGFPGSSYELKIEKQYRNMKVVLDQHPQITANALEAIRRAGLTPRRASIRGGTDGSRLSFMGLPCPNIFAGEHAFHSRLEWVSVQDMEKAVETIVHLAMIWEETGCMSALPEADRATREYFINWLETFSGYVREIDYASARPLFHPDVLAFGTHRDVIPGLAEWQATQWDNVWPKTTDFRFDVAGTHVLVSADNTMATVVAPWTSTGYAQDGSKFDRPGRATMIFNKENGAWLCTHSHMSLNRGVPQQSYANRPVKAK